MGGQGKIKKAIKPKNHIEPANDSRDKIYHGQIEIDPTLDLFEEIKKLKKKKKKKTKKKKKKKKFPEKKKKKKKQKFIFYC